MNHNIYTGRPNNSRAFFQSTIFMWIQLVVLITFNVSSCIPRNTENKSVDIATVFPQSAIEDASKVIINFERLWTSEQAHRNPSIQEELATGKYLEYWGYKRLNLDSEPFWLVTDSVELESIRLIEYKDDYFKAKACVISYGRKIKPDGSLVNVLSHPPYGLCGLYVFVKNTDKWKLLGYVETMDPRTYEYAPDWLKEIIGDIPVE